MGRVRLTGYRLGHVRIALRHHFATALRSVTHADDIVLRIETDAGVVGWGEAPPTPQITGETHETLRAAIPEQLGAIEGVDLLDRDEVARRLEFAVPGNTSARAAVDIAVHDAVARSLGVPLVVLLGGLPKTLVTDLTISLDSPEAMAAAAAESVGFDLLKVKLGGDVALDVARLRAVAEAAPHARLLADANQAWTADQAIAWLARVGVPVELLEQPVPADDLAGLRQVTHATDVPVLADEAVFTPLQAMLVAVRRAADIVNVKLMKAGGLRGAERIAAVAEAGDLGLFVGSMLESRIAVSAAAHFAAAHGSVVGVDLDGPLLCASDPVVGGVRFEGQRLTIPDAPGLGIEEVHDVEWF